MTALDWLAQILPYLDVDRGPDRRGEYAAWCPYHPDGQGKPPHEPNLHVSERGFICFACGAKGGLKKLAQKLGSTSAVEMAAPDHAESVRRTRIATSRVISYSKSSALIRGDSSSGGRTARVAGYGT